MDPTILFRCPKCQAERRVPWADVGRQVRCFQCGELVEVREVPQAAAPLDEEPSVAPPPIEHPLPPHLVSAHQGRPLADDFDPYYRWLAIPKVEQPPNHYRLLGLPLFESDPDVIFNSSERQMAHVKAQAGGRHVAIGQRLLNELSMARICLLDAERKAEYDAELRRKQSTAAGRAPEVADPRQPASANRSQREGPAHQTPISSLASAPRQPLPAKSESLFIEPPPLQEPPAPPVQSRWKGGPEPPPPLEAEEPKEQAVFRRRIIEGDMDMTPMIDVTFLLLIFFICTASFALQMTKPIPSPQEDEPSTTAQSIAELEDNPDNVTVRVDAYNTFRVITPDTDDEAPSYQELIVRLRAARQGGSLGKIPTTLVVIANGQALHEKVVQALDAGTEVGMEKMQLMWVEQDE